MGIEENLERDRTAIKASIINYLAENSDGKDSILSDNSKKAVKRDDINIYVQNGDIRNALLSLDALRDLKTGIDQELIPAGDGSIAILVRDARNCSIPAVRNTEAFEMQYLNAIGAAKDIAATSPNKGNIEQALKDLAINTIKSAPALGDKLRHDQKKLAREYKKKIQDIAKMMEQDYGVSDAHKKLNVAKDFQNFKDIHANIVTISTLKDGDKKHTIIEAEVGLKGLTTEQRAQYQNIQDFAKYKIRQDPKGLTKKQISQYEAINNVKLPKWYTKMSSWEQKLIEDNAQNILDDKHIIPAQLRQIAGMRNAFEKITMTPSATQIGELDILHSSKHSGTLASLTKETSERANITSANVKQLKEWSGDALIQCNLLNSGPIGAGNDPTIVKLTNKAIKENGGEVSKLPFNAMRRFGVITNDFTGIKHSLGLFAQENDALKKHLEARGKFARTFGLNKPEGEPEDIIKNLNISDEKKQFYRDAIDLRKSVEEADKLVRFGDSKNINLELATKSSLLNNARNELIDSKQISGEKQMILTTCASGKDRTGLAEQDQTNQAIGNRFKMAIDEVDRQLLSNGHTAGQAGSVHAGGGTIGCFGTKDENKYGIPNLRLNLTTIIETSANNNKIKKDSKLKTFKARIISIFKIKDKGIESNVSPTVDNKPKMDTKTKWEKADISTFPKDKETDKTIGNIEVIATHRPMSTPKTQVAKDSRKSSVYKS